MAHSSSHWAQMRERPSTGGKQRRAAPGLTSLGEASEVAWAAGGAGLDRSAVSGKAFMFLLITGIYSSDGSLSSERELSTVHTSFCHLHWVESFIGPAQATLRFQQKGLGCDLPVTFRGPESFKANV